VSHVMNQIGEFSDVTLEELREIEDLLNQL